MIILVLNSGSSSLKYQLINTQTKLLLAKGNFERIGQQSAFLTHKIGEEKHKFEMDVPDHEMALNIILGKLTSKTFGVISGVDCIDAIGHRIVHGGDKFTSSVLINDEVIKQIEECIPLAPLHNPAALEGIKACMEILPGKPNVACFDTAFHQTMAKEQYIYPIPYKYYEKYKIRKYGFHGISHDYVSHRIASLKGVSIEDLRIVNCHLGQGASICAINKGKSVETSMGFTPVAGIPMGTRSGDLDPSVVTYIMKKENMTASEVEDMLNKQSGVQGISGLAPDFRVIESESYTDNERAKIAMESFKYAVASYIAKYAVAMNGIDAIVFTGGVGENQINIRKGICKQLEFMGVIVDEEANNVRGEERLITKPESKIRAYIIPTNEELMIAKETEKLVNYIK